MKPKRCFRKRNGLHFDSGNVRSLIKKNLVPVNIQIRSDSNA